ncbi:MAG: hypothetical protein ACRD1Z_21335, partial [Vicinamibacteria bacterium]
DYPVTPEAHMRNIRRLGEECLREAEEAMKTGPPNVEEARRVADYMKAYKLLADYYEQKVLAAVSALIYGFGGDKSDQAEAELRGDEAVQRYEEAIHFIEEHIDRKAGTLKGRWGGRELRLAELVEREKDERKELGKLFRWPAR